VLTMELGDLKKLDLDLSWTGFDPRELGNLLLTKTEDADATPPLPAHAVTKPGPSAHSMQPRSAWLERSLLTLRNPVRSGRLSRTL
jgi:hypothetical protein